MILPCCEASRDQSETAKVQRVAVHDAADHWFDTFGKGSDRTIGQFEYLLSEVSLMSKAISRKLIESRIYEIRGKKVMLDADLADLYETETRNLKRQVTRNQERFPEDFAFHLTREEFNDLRSQIGTSSWGGTRYLPVAFTEHGILMLSNVLRSDRAIQVSVQIIRVFNAMREMIGQYKELFEKVQKIERRQDIESKAIWNALRLVQKELMGPPGSGK